MLKTLNDFPRDHPSVIAKLASSVIESSSIQADTQMESNFLQ